MVSREYYFKACMFYIVLILTRMCMFPFQILLDVLVVTQTNKTVVMTATAGLMAGTQIFREEDSDKLYPNGLLTMIGLVILGLILTGLQEFIYYVQNRKAERHGNHTALNIL